MERQGNTRKTEFSAPPHFPVHRATCHIPKNPSLLSFFKQLRPDEQVRARWPILLFSASALLTLLSHPALSSSDRLPTSRTAFLSPFLPSHRFPPFFTLTPAPSTTVREFPGRLLLCYSRFSVLAPPPSVSPHPNQLLDCRYETRIEPSSGLACKWELVKATNKQVASTVDAVHGRPAFVCTHLSLEKDYAVRLMRGVDVIYEAAVDMTTFRQALPQFFCAEREQLVAILLPYFEALEIVCTRKTSKHPKRKASAKKTGRKNKKWGFERFDVLEGLDGRLGILWTGAYGGATGGYRLFCSFADLQAFLNDGAHVKPTNYTNKGRQTYPALWERNSVDGVLKKYSMDDLMNQVWPALFGNVA